MVLDSVATSYIGWPPPAFCLHLRRALFVPFDNARVVQGERRAELARAMLSRSPHSRLHLECKCKAIQKTEVHEIVPCTSVGFSVGSVGFSVGFTFPTLLFCCSQDVFQLSFGRRRQG